MAKTIWRSGFCETGLHEGSKPLSYQGTPQSTCKRFFSRDSYGRLIECECECHVSLDEMFKMMEMERTIVDNPEYHPTHRTWWMPQDDPNYGLDPVGTNGNMPAAAYRTPAGAPVPPVRVRDYGPTPTGRKARGELEYRVKEICDLFAAGELDEEFCTPKVIASTISTGEPPSVGAIDAIFKRWEELGFAVIEKKPTRFHTYTPDGWTKGLDRLKEERRRAEKHKSAAQRRGERV